MRYSANSDTVDTSAAQQACNGNGTGNINLSNEASKATSDALTLRSVASTFPFVEPGDSNISANGVTTYDPSSQVEDKWKTSGTVEPSNGLQTCGNGQYNQNYSYNNGNLKRYSDNDHYLRKSASVQIIAHEPSRCEGCFDGRLPLLLIVVFIALVLFLLCIGVILDAEGNNFLSTRKLLIILFPNTVFSGKDTEESTSTMHQTTGKQPELLLTSFMSTLIYHLADLTFFQRVQLRAKNWSVPTEQYARQTPTMLLLAIVPFSVQKV